MTGWSRYLRNFSVNIIRRRVNPIRYRGYVPALFSRLCVGDATQQECQKLETTNLVRVWIKHIHSKCKTLIGSFLDNWYLSTINKLLSTLSPCFTSMTFLICEWSIWFLLFWILLWVFSTDDSILVDFKMAEFVEGEHAMCFIKLSLVIGEDSRFHQPTVRRGLTYGRWGVPWSNSLQILPGMNGSAMDMHFCTR